MLVMVLKEFEDHSGAADSATVEAVKIEETGTTKEDLLKDRRVVLNLVLPMFPGKEDPELASTVNEISPIEPHLPRPFLWPICRSPLTMMASRSCSKI